jgi:thiamine-phosphate pyrophosphorylase
VLPKLYAILDAELSARRGLDPLHLADVWLEAGVRLFQLRAKRLASGPFFTLASALAERARASGATFIVNDRADIAAASGAAGVHLGQDDLGPADVNLLQPSLSVIGVSTHSAAQLDAALTQPVTYVAIGPVFPTATKARPDPVVGLEGVRQAVTRAAGLPVVAIGGITLERAPKVQAAGATSVAVISDLLEGDPARRVRAFLDTLRET